MRKGTKRLSKRRRGSPKAVSSRRKIQSIEQFIEIVRQDAAASPSQQPRWFRGEPETDTPLTPTLYRRSNPHENILLQTFRTRASGFHDVVPDREATDQWLFLARHAGLPTRLLDWSEGALIALYFALSQTKGPPVVWMLNPLQLNYHAMGSPANRNPNDEREFPLTWVNFPPAVNIGFANIAGAWGRDAQSVDLPVAVHPAYVHPRLRSQRACFTVHGRRKEGLNMLAPSPILRRYTIDPRSREVMYRDLLTLGVTESVLFPDLDGLAKELTDRYWTES